MSLKRQ